MNLPYEKATAGNRALLDIQKTLAAFGCAAFGTMIDEEHRKVIVSFRWRQRQINLEASWQGYAAAYQKRRPYSYHARGSRADYNKKVLAQARVSVCSVLRDWVKGQVTAVECGIMSFEAAFMPHILMPNGGRLVDFIESHKLLTYAEPEDASA